ncbi:leukemia inhibitory factor receptor isoform X2 [Genypterus blacodes]|uniref:leukemia inhibitory factor receptor isoform X2 n=1 Tax=Genypterus blacodes TaxID=154954 RepID=UPI003F77316A
MISPYRSHVFILGLMVVYHTTLSPHVQVASENCKPNTLSTYQHCAVHPDGVSDLNCFSRPPAKTWQCAWKPGNHTSNKTYTIIVQQQSKNRCNSWNVSGLSQTMRLFESDNMTAHVFEHDSARCTKAYFSGLPRNQVRCGPPLNVTFRRHSGKLEVDVIWRQEEKSIQHYSLRFKARGARNESSMTSHDKQGSSVDNLNSSLVYSVQIQCVTSRKCTKCPSSEIYTVPPELTLQPVIVRFEDTDIAQKKGRRLLLLNWKSPVPDRPVGYHVSVGKASGEAPHEVMKTTKPKIRLILSYSLFHLNISAFNNASTSPAVSVIIPAREDTENMRAGRLNVTLSSNSSLTLYWKDDLIKTYSCYSVEWGKKFHKVAYRSFFEDAHNYKSLPDIKDPLERYKRYSITLHTRPNKEPCNMKHINNSESTYGQLDFYLMEGTPLSGPTNISIKNVTQNSMLLQWSSIPEDNLRGFLLGYIISYTDNQQETQNVTVDPEFNTYELKDLKSSTVYRVQISAVTLAGAGVQSPASLLRTNSQGGLSLGGLITACVVVAIVVIFGSPLIKRVKVILWPSIPNPGNSSTMQKLDAACELDFLKPTKHQVEEWDTISLQIIEKEPLTADGSLQSVLPHLHDLEEEDNSPAATGNWIQIQTENPSTDALPGDTQAMFTNTQQTDLQSSPLALSSDYTTMELFLQGALQSVPTIKQATEIQPDRTDLTVVRSGPGYLRQFSTNEDISEVLLSLEHKLYDEDEEG